MEMIASAPTRPRRSETTGRSLIAPRPSRRSLAGDISAARLSGDQAPDQQSGNTDERALSKPVRSPEDGGSKSIARIEIDETGAEFVDHNPTRMDRQDFEKCQRRKGHAYRHVLQKPRRDEENRQDIDEPERSERFDESHQIGVHHTGNSGFAGNARRLERKLDRQPQNIEIEKIHDLAVKITPPWPVDHKTEKQA